LHDFVGVSDGAPVDGAALERALKEWRKAYEQGASLRITVHPDGSSLIEDQRQIRLGGPAYELSAPETELYLFLDSGIKLSAVASTFLMTHPEAGQAIQETPGIEATVEHWLRDGLLLATENRVVSLALHSERNRPGSVHFARPPAFDMDAGPLVSIDLANTPT
jgi:hypothetical protein